MAKRKRYLQNIALHDKKVVSSFHHSPVSVSWLWPTTGWIFVCTILIVLGGMLKGNVHLATLLTQIVHGLSVYGLPLVLSIALVFAGGWAYRRHRLLRTELKLLSLDEDGILIGTYRSGQDRWQDKTEKLLWADIETIDIAEKFRLMGGFKKYIYIQRKYKTIEETWEPAVVYRINWDNITSMVSPERFFSEVQTRIPKALTDDVLDAAKLEPDAVQYTHLWLQYFSTPTVRQRKGVLPEGTIVGDGTYEVERILGGGGQGTAYLAKSLKEKSAEGSKQLPEKVVLKEYVLPVHRGEDLAKNKSEDLNHEAKILGQIDHQNIVRLIDCFIEDHRGYLVLEYVEGESLSDLVKQAGPQDESSICKWAISICDILAYLHGMSPPVIHRDLTPDNLMIQKDGAIKLMDFTVAHQLESGATANMVGKQAYIPPEQFSGSPCPESDIYALGCTMHYLLTGREPEPLESSDPCKINNNVSAPVSAVVKTATSLDPGKRYGSADALRKALSEIR